ncbi:hypothetical protein HGD85_00515, partial [Rhodobacteraceae bacterium R_SAG10]|nr:hypothetical protein [Rhodobacteraceae bacterium R_SAG10]
MRIILPFDANMAVLPNSAPIDDTMAPPGHDLKFKIGTLVVGVNALCKGAAAQHRHRPAGITVECHWPTILWFGQITLKSSRRHLAEQLHGELEVRHGALYVAICIGFHCVVDDLG